MVYQECHRHNVVLGCPRTRSKWGKGVSCSSLSRQPQLELSQPDYSGCGTGRTSSLIRTQYVLPRRPDQTAPEQPLKNRMLHLTVQAQVTPPEATSSDQQLILKTISVRWLARGEANSAVPVHSQTGVLGGIC